MYLWLLLLCPLSLPVCYITRLRGYYILYMFMDVGGIHDSIYINIVIDGSVVDYRLISNSFISFLLFLLLPQDETFQSCGNICFDPQTNKTVAESFSDAAGTATIFRVSLTHSIHPSIHPSIHSLASLHFISFHFISFHFISLHCTSLYFARSCRSSHRVHYLAQDG